jgi:hypothetical protein
VEQRGDNNLPSVLVGQFASSNLIIISGKICSTDEFQCNNKGYDRNVPDCIDSKHKCDGVPQCADGSRIIHFTYNFQFLTEL